MTEWNGGVDYWSGALDWTTGVPRPQISYARSLGPQIRCVHDPQP